METPRVPQPIQQPQRAFKLDGMRFEKMPEDADLVWLLGERASSQVRVVDAGHVSTGEALVIPLKYVVSWILYIAAFAFCLIWSYGSLSDVVLFTAIGAHAIGFFILFVWYSNHEARKTGYFFRADAARGTLELPRIEKTFECGAMLAFIELHRWYKSPALPWESVSQTGVLVRDDDGSIVHYPVVHDYRRRILEPPLGEQLAGLFDADFRNVKLNERQSRALGDC